MATTPETEVLVPLPKLLRLVDGTEFTVPAISWGREIRLLRVIKDVMQEAMQSGLFNRQLDEDGNPVTIDENLAIQKFLSLLLGTAPEKLTEAASAITGQKPEWVLEKLTIEPIVELVIFFLRSKQDSLLQVLQPYLPTAVAVVGNTTLN